MSKLNIADSLVQAFLRTAREQGDFNALVVYGIQEGGKALLRLASNHENPKVATGIWNWLTHMDAKTAEACGRALHEREGGCVVCTSFEALMLTTPLHSWITAKKRPWAELDTDAQKKHVEAAEIVIEVARMLSGRALNAPPLISA